MLCPIPTRRFILLFIPLTLLFTTCQNNADSSGKTDGENAEEVDLTLDFATAKGMALTLEANHSTIGFSLPIAGGATTVRGSFHRSNLFIDYISGDLEASQVEFLIDASSIDTDITNRDNDLRGPTFFDVEKHPFIRFKSSRIQRIENGWIAKGTFSMKGISKDLSIPFEVTEQTESSLGIKIRMELSRIDFGVGADWKHTAIPNFLAENVQVEIDFWTRKAKIQNGD